MATELKFLWRLFFVLLAIDRAAEALNHFSGYQSPTAWPDTTIQMYQNGISLNRGRRKVTLVPPSLFPNRTGSWWDIARKNGQWADIQDRGDHHSRHFLNICRIPEIGGCEIDHDILLPGLETQDADWSQLTIGLVPLIDTLRVEGSQCSLAPGPIQIVRGDQNRLVICTRKNATEQDFAPLCDRAESAIRHLAKRQAQIIVFPEAVVPDPVLIRIKRVLRELAAAGNDCPFLVLAGTFIRERRNQAVILNGRGRELWRQCKLHRYEMQDYEQKKYGLDRIFDATPASEDIETHPRKMVFRDFEHSCLRVVVTICEDFVQYEPCLRAIRALRPNLVLVPVMAGELLENRGFASTARQCQVKLAALL